MSTFITFTKVAHFGSEDASLEPSSASSAGSTEKPGGRSFNASSAFVRPAFVRTAAVGFADVGTTLGVGLADGVSDGVVLLTEGDGDPESDPPQAASGRETTTRAASAGRCFDM